MRRQSSVRASVGFTDARVLDDAGNRLLCRIAGKEVWVPVAAIRQGSKVWAVEDCGTLIVADWFVARVSLSGGPCFAGAPLRPRV